MMLCECGELMDGCTFKDYIDTSANPSTATIGHRKCGLIYDFVDGKAPKRYSSKKELKVLAVKFAKKRHLDDEAVGRFLVLVDRIKSDGKLPDAEVCARAIAAMGL